MKLSNFKYGMCSIIYGTWKVRYKIKRTIRKRKEMREGGQEREWGKYDKVMVSIMCTYENARMEAIILYN
jgi:hypothetical protein